MVRNFVEAVVPRHPAGSHAPAVAGEVEARQALGGNDYGGGVCFGQKSKMAHEVGRQLAVAVAHEPYPPRTGR